eukprot:1522618-Pyramimonas_sp.AAC.1
MPVARAVPIPTRAPLRPVGICPRNRCSPFPRLPLALCICSLGTLGDSSLPFTTPLCGPLV